jgi:hypothetical protein
MLARRQWLGVGVLDPDPMWPSADAQLAGKEPDDSDRPQCMSCGREPADYRSRDNNDDPVALRTEQEAQRRVPLGFASTSATLRDGFMAGAPQVHSRTTSGLCRASGWPAARPREATPKRPHVPDVAGVRLLAAGAQRARPDCLPTLPTRIAREAGCTRGRLHVHVTAAAVRCASNVPLPAEAAQSVRDAVLAQGEAGSGDAPHTGSWPPSSNCALSASEALVRNTKLVAFRVLHDRPAVTV